jgi:hypothetical protein
MLRAKRTHVIPGLLAMANPPAGGVAWTRNLIYLTIRHIWRIKIIQIPDKIATDNLFGMTATSSPFFLSLFTGLILVS